MFETKFYDFHGIKMNRIYNNQIQNIHLSSYVVRDFDWRRNDAEVWADSTRLLVLAATVEEDADVAAPTPPTPLQRYVDAGGHLLALGDVLPPALTAPCRPLGHQVSRESPQRTPLIVDTISCLRCLR